MIVHPGHPKKYDGYFKSGCSIPRSGLNCPRASVFGSHKLRGNSASNAWNVNFNNGNCNNNNVNNNNYVRAVR